MELPYSPEAENERQFTVALRSAEILFWSKKPNIRLHTDSAAGTALLQDERPRKALHSTTGETPRYQHSQRLHAMEQYIAMLCNIHKMCTTAPKPWPK